MENCSADPCLQGPWLLARKWKLFVVRSSFPFFFFEKENQKSKILDNKEILKYQQMTKRPSLKSLQITNAGKDAEKKEPSYTVVGNVNW